MQEVIETLLLIALIGAFIAFVAALTLSRGDDASKNRMRTVAVAASLVSFVSLVFYLASPHQEIRRTVYQGAPESRQP